jgi:hypothetical protein
MVAGREEEAMVRVAAGRWRARGRETRCLVKWVRRRDATMVMWKIEGRKWDWKVEGCEE